jgi:hypothetical protein
MTPSTIADLGAAANLSIPEDRLQGVIDTFAITMAMAARVMTADLPIQSLENAPVFDAWWEKK